MGGMEALTCTLFLWFSQCAPDNCVFQLGGKIKWDYAISSVPVYPYSDQNFGWRVFVEVICVFQLAVNCYLEFSGKKKKKQLESLSACACIILEFVCMH